MASSCGPFHEEALRRQRVVDKRRAALQRLAVAQEDERKMAAEKQRLDEEARHRRHADKVAELERHLNEVKGDKSRSAASKRRDVIPDHVMHQIKTQGKILRNHNLVIGHPMALWQSS